MGVKSSTAASLLLQVPDKHFPVPGTEGTPPEPSGSPPLAAPAVGMGRTGFCLVLLVTVL